MRKYIRTKDRIVELKKMTINDKLTDDYIHEKAADTIEELCDEFVIKVDNEYLHAKYYPVDKTFYIYNTEEEISLEECLRFNYVVKGAIWTEWGLKYVAKMNEKGELELL